MAVFVQTVSDAKQSLVDLQEQLINSVESSRKKVRIQVGETRDRGITTIVGPILKLARRVPAPKAITQPVERRLEVVLKSAIEPFENYDEFTAKEVVAKLRTVDAYTVSKVEKYEFANKRRKTVMRAL